MIKNLKVTITMNDLIELENAVSVGNNLWKEHINLSVKRTYISNSDYSKVRREFNIHPTLKRDAVVMRSAKTRGWSLFNNTVKGIITQNANAAHLAACDVGIDYLIYSASVEKGKYGELVIDMIITLGLGICQHVLFDARANNRTFIIKLNKR